MEKCFGFVILFYCLQAIEWLDHDIPSVKEFQNLARVSTIPLCVASKNVSKIMKLAFIKF